jgi:hypothetical protein
MPTQNKNKTVLIVTGLIAVATLGYFGYKFWREKHPKQPILPEPPVIEPPVENKPTSTDLSVHEISNPFKNETEVKAFQDWMDKNHPFWIKDTDGKYKNLRVGTVTEPARHVSGKGYGKFGVNTANAYELFGKEYLTGITASAGASGSIPKDVESAISTIVKNATGSKSDSAYLKRNYLANPDKYREYIMNWAKAIDIRVAERNKKAFVGGSTFVFANQVYDSYEGVRRLEKLPLGKTAETTKDDATMRWHPMWDTTTTSKLGKNIKLGVIKAYFFNDTDKQLFLFIPDPQVMNSIYMGLDYKWVWAGAVKF